MNKPRACDKNLMSGSTSTRNVWGAAPLSNQSLPIFRKYTDNLQSYINQQQRYQNTLNLSTTARYNRDLAHSIHWTTFQLHSILIHTWRLKVFYSFESHSEQGLFKFQFLCSSRLKRENFSRPIIVKLKSS